jgi:hypothetical protein
VSKSLVDLSLGSFTLAKNISGHLYNEKPLDPQGKERFEMIKVNLLVCSCCHNVDTATTFVEEHFTIAQSKERVVASDAYIEAWCPAGAALTNDDVASDDCLATEFFYAETLAT